MPDDERSSLNVFCTCYDALGRYKTKSIRIQIEQDISGDVLMTLPRKVDKQTPETISDNVIYTE